MSSWLFALGPCSALSSASSLSHSPLYDWLPMTNAYVIPYLDCSHSWQPKIQPPRILRSTQRSEGKTSFVSDSTIIMRLVSAYPGLALVLLTHVVSAQLVLPQAQPRQQQPFDAHHEDLDQIPIEVGFGWHEPNMEGLQPNGPPLLSDILGIDRSLSIFAGLGRSIESIVCLSLWISLCLTRLIGDII